MIHKFFTHRFRLHRVALCFLSLCILVFSAGAPAQASENGGFPNPALPIPGARESAGLFPSSGELPDPRVQALIDRVTPALVYSYLAGLSGEQPVLIGGDPYLIRDRNTWNEQYGNEGIQHATQYAHEKFLSYGLTTSNHVWDLQTNPNVIAEQPGYETPERIYYLTAHLDDMPYIAPNVLAAPGADDNASGSVGVLIAAEILSEVDCRYTLRYILFTGEEQGLLGSRAYVDTLLEENILGVLNLDMIGWDSDGDTALDLYARQGYPEDHRIASTFTWVVNAYDLPLLPEILGNRMSGSDHAAFWDRGFPAILAIEDLSDFNDYYHTSEDRLIHLNLEYLTAFVRASIGTLAHLACLAPAPVYFPVLLKNPGLSR